ncbi:MAG: thioesterase family protein [Christensenellales bacterium]|jgi:fluoroacetyl-CoA thioesterase
MQGTGRCEIIVGQGDTALAAGSGSLPVLATPRLIAMMERAAVMALEGLLEEGYTSVGVHIQAEHLSATPVGMKAWAVAQLRQAQGRRYTLDLEAHDEAGPIGRGTHTRVAVEARPFMEKTQNKGRKQEGGEG